MQQETQPLYLKNMYIDSGHILFLTIFLLYIGINVKTKKQKTKQKQKTAETSGCKLFISSLVTKIVFTTLAITVPLTESEVIITRI